MDDKIVKVAAFLIIGSVLVPIVIGGAVGVANAVGSIMYNQKIKKGLKNGSIVEINGKYYKSGVEEA